MDSAQLEYLLGPSGGIFYHLAAIRFRRRLWAPFVEELNGWLSNDWNPRAGELIVFGASAGWTLSEGFLGRFSKVIAVEPDPLARLIFRRRFPSVEVEFVARHDLLPWSSARGDEFAGFLSRAPGAAILFSNLLGQIALHRRHSDEADARHLFQSALADREWASYHDLFSAQTGVANAAAVHHEASPDLDLETLAAQVFDARDRIDVVDHETSWLLADRAWVSIPWRLSPRRTHLIACVKGGPRAGETIAGEKIGGKAIRV